MSGRQTALEPLIEAQREWSLATFGPGSRLAGILDHIRKELLEVEEDPTDAEEWVDVVILALDGAWRAGHSPEAIVDTLLAKYERNRNRTWPDWRTAPAGIAIEHIEDGEQPAHVRGLSGAGVAAGEAARVARYAEAMHAITCDATRKPPCPVDGNLAWNLWAEASVAVADAEMEQLREALDRLGERVAYYRDSEVPALRSNADGWAARAERAERERDDLRAKVEALADEYAERSADTENADRYPWGVAGDDLRAVLGVRP